MKWAKEEGFKRRSRKNIKVNGGGLMMRMIQRKKQKGSNELKFWNKQWVKVKRDKYGGKRLNAGGVMMKLFVGV